MQLSLLGPPLSFPSSRSTRPANSGSLRASLQQISRRPQAASGKALQEYEIARIVSWQLHNACLQSLQKQDAVVDSGQVSYRARPTSSGYTA